MANMSKALLIYSVISKDEHCQGHDERALMVYREEKLMVSVLFRVSGGHYEETILPEQDVSDYRRKSRMRKIATPISRTSPDSSTAGSRGSSTVKKPLEGPSR